MERVEFISHRGKQVLFVDLSGCGPEEIIETADRVQEVVSGQPRSSVLLVADFTGVRIDKTAVTHLKEVATRDVPYVYRAAWVGAESIPETWMRSIETFSTRKMVRFSSREAALDWIVAEEGSNAARSA